jgi:disulfide bond formation protein DsbB
VLTSTTSLIGLGISGYHVWLQYLPKEKIPSCGPDLSYLLENFPFHEAMMAVFQGAGECTKIDWYFLGFSLAEFALAGMIILVGLCLTITFNILKQFKKNKG